MTSGWTAGQFIKTAKYLYETVGRFIGGKPYMQALAGQVNWVRGALWRTCRQKQGDTSFSPSKVFLFSRNSRDRFLGLIFWHLWIGRAQHPGPDPLTSGAGLLMRISPWRLVLLFLLLLSIG